MPFHTGRSTCLKTIYQRVRYVGGTASEWWILQRLQQHSKCFSYKYLVSQLLKDKRWKWQWNLYYIFFVNLKEKLIRSWSVLWRKRFRIHHYVAASFQLTRWNHWTEINLLINCNGCIGSSVADPWHFGVDPDPDPSIFIIDLQGENQKPNKKKVFLHITFWRYFYIIQR